MSLGSTAETTGIACENAEVFPAGLVTVAVIHRPTGTASRCTKNEGEMMSVSPTGVEPVTFGSGGQRSDFPRAKGSKGLRKIPSGGVPKVVPTSLHRFSNSSLTPELAKILDAWQSLPPVVQASVLAIIETAKGGHANGFKKS